MAEQKHTPTPWRVDIDDTGDPITGGYPSISPTDDRLDTTIVHWDGFHHEFWDSHPSKPTQVANAEFIVKAVNSHEALLSAAKKAANELSVMLALNPARDGGLYREALDGLNAAIKLAEEQ